METLKRYVCSLCGKPMESNSTAEGGWQHVVDGDYTKCRIAQGYTYITNNKQDQDYFKKRMAIIDEGGNPEEKQGRQMYINIDWKQQTAEVIKSWDDPEIYTESSFFYNVKKTLQVMGFDVIKKLMWKDGHLMGDKHTYYVRDRLWRYGIYDNYWAVRDVVTEFRDEGKVELWIAKFQDDWKEEWEHPRLKSFFTGTWG